MQLIGVDIKYHFFEIQHVCGGPSGFDDGDDFDVFRNEGTVVCTFIPGE